MKLLFTESSLEKYNLLEEHVKKQVNHIFDDIIDGLVSEKNMHIFMRIKDKFFFSIKKSKVYIILTRKDTKADWVVVDFLTHIEYNRMV